MESKMIQGTDKRRRYSRVGRHLVCDIWGASNIPSQVDDVITLLKDASKIGNATVLGEISHQFNPVGITSVLLLAESHISFHSWPENEYVAIDIFTCGDKMDPERSVKYIIEKMNPAKVNVRLIERGEQNEIAKANHKMVH